MSERWTPKVGELYYFVSTAGEIISETFYNYEAGSRSRFLYGNVFETQAAAEAAAEKVRELLLSLHEPVTDCNQLPKLTAEVFDRPDCPEWAKFAAVDKYGQARYYSSCPVHTSTNWLSKGLNWQYIQENHQCVHFDAYDWMNSLIKRPPKDAFDKAIKKYAQQQADKILQKARERRWSEQYHNGPKTTTLPDWCKVGEWIHSPSDGGCYCKITDIEDDRIFTHSFGDAICFYIKPGDSFSSLRLSQARLRPYNAEEMKALVGKIVKKGRNLYLVTAYIEEQQSIIIASLSSSLFDAELLIVNNMTIDGNPCGVLEHLKNGKWVK